MSGGLEMERIRVGGGELSMNNIAQTLLGESTVGGIEPGGISSGGGGSNHTIREDLLHGPNAIKRNRKIRRYQHQQHQNKKHFGGGKRIRRNTQSAPNNTNEFLMQEHDHLFHLDFENEDWEANNAATEDFNLSSLSNNHNHTFYSSSEDDEDFLSREFSATYDNVNAERLSSMSKAELISEYQQLEERVETLERKLKSCLGGEETGTSPPTRILTEEEKVRLVEEEIARLRNENLKIRADNQFLRKMMYGDPSEGDSAMVGDGDGGSMDSGGGSASGSDLCQ